MPLPTPSSGEDKNKFISRCMSATKGEFPDQKQRTAVCFSQWRKKRGGKKPEGFNEIIYNRPILVESVGEGNDRKVFLKGTAIDVGVSRNNVDYNEKELQASAKTLIGKPLLRQHSASSPFAPGDDIGNVIGKVVETDFDGKNILFKAEVDTEEKDILRKLEKGFINFVSIGADYKSCSEDDDGIIHPVGIEFLELALVPVPGVPNATISQVIAESYRVKKMEEKKSEQLEEELKKIKEENESLRKKLTEEETSDEKPEKEPEEEKPAEGETEKKDETEEKVESLSKEVTKLTEALKKMEEKPKAVTESAESKKKERFGFKHRLEIEPMEGKTGMSEIYSPDSIVENTDPNSRRKWELY